MPFCIIYIFNWVMFIVIIIKLLRRKKTRVIELSTAQVVKRNLMIAVGLSLVFGLGWGIGLTATTSDTKEVTFTFQVIFSVFVGAQGVLIFIFHGIRSPDFRHAWRSIFCIMQEKKYSASALQYFRETKKCKASYNMASTNPNTLPKHSDQQLPADNTERYTETGCNNPEASRAINENHCDEKKIESIKQKNGTPAKHLAKELK